jgi:uncharacterized membrane protein required for colicin V production
MSFLLNLVLILLIAGATVGGLLRGLRRELIGLMGVVASFAGGILLAKPVSVLFARWGVMAEVPYMLAFVVGFVAASLAYSILKGPLVPREIDTSERLSGGAVGLAKGLLVAALLVYLLVGIFPGVRPTVAKAPAAGLVMPLTPVIDGAATLLGRLLPPEFTERVRAGYRSFRDAGEGLSDAIQSLKDTAEEAKEITSKVEEGKARLDSLTAGSRPPP